MSLKLDSVSTLLNEPDAAPVHSVTLFVALVSACIVIGHLLQKTRWMNQSVTALAFVSFVAFIQDVNNFLFILIVSSFTKKGS